MSTPSLDTLVEQIDTVVNLIPRECARYGGEKIGLRGKVAGAVLGYALEVAVLSYVPLVGGLVSAAVAFASPLSAGYRYARR